MTDIFGDTEHTPMLTPSEILEYVYCPRFIWFMNVQNIPQHEDTRFKVLKGREIHKKRTIENRNYLRRKIEAVKREIEVYLASPKLRIRGIVDEVLWLSDGTMAALDYKYTKAQEQERVFKTHEMQILIYSMLIHEIYQTPVTHGYVAYIRGGNQLIKVHVTQEKFNEISVIVQEIFDIIHTGRLPRKTPNRVRCQDCCYKNICV